MSEPMLVPAMKSIGIRCCSSTRNTPMCAAPRAPPPLRASPMRGRWAGAAVAVDAASPGCHARRIAQASGSNDHWKQILTVMGREDLFEDARYKDQPGRIKFADDVDALINAWSETRSVDEVLKGLESKGIPCAPVRGIPEVLKDKNFLDSGAIVPVVHPIHGEIPSVKAAGQSDFRS